MLITDEQLQSATESLPNSEVDFLRSYFNEPSNTQLRHIIIRNRMNNAICSNLTCPNYKGPPNLICDKCYCTFYCTTLCQEKDKERHVKWCCQKDGDRDMGPMRSAVLIGR